MAATIIIARPYSDEDARQLGQHHGYAAANYAANVSGEEFSGLRAEDTMPLAIAADERAAMFYRDGFDTGIDEYQIDDYMSDSADYDELAGVA
jgi:hypothetical protein